MYIGDDSRLSLGKGGSLALSTCSHRADTQTLLFHLTMWLVRRVLRLHCSCAELSGTLGLLFTIQLPFYSSPPSRDIRCIRRHFPNRILCGIIKFELYFFIRDKQEKIVSYLDISNFTKSLMLFHSQLQIIVK